MATKWPWHRPIFPGLGDPSIVGAGAFHCRVRYGNGWGHSALATRTIGSPHELGWVIRRVSELSRLLLRDSRSALSFENVDPADLMQRKIEARALGH
jgi:hypothetical protein